LFETGDQPPDDFFEAVLRYCELARSDHTPAMLRAEGNLARERVMASEIARVEGPVVVVTGGFHTVALPGTKPGPPPKVPAGVTSETFLIRYGFQQLDRLNGYQSGLPLPGFYHDLWEGTDPATRLVEVARSLRPQGISPADAVEAVRHLRGLCAFRGHRLPSREDVLDSVRSVFIKGADDVEGALVLAEACKHLAGQRVGRLPLGVARAPLVLDFASSAEALKLPVDTPETRELSLDLYRSASHRAVSRFLHRLGFLDVPYGICTGGPDFARGSGTELLHEHWRVGWSPTTEAALVERSALGASLEEAASQVLADRLQGLPERSSNLVARLVVEAARMGLHAYLEPLLAETMARLAEDPGFVSTVDTLSQLLLLREGREPLEAGDLPGMAGLIRTAFERACFLLPAPDGDGTSALAALKTLEQCSLKVETPDLRFAGLERLAHQEHSLLVGAALGLLFVNGRLEARELEARARAAWAGKGGVDFLRGLMATARSVLWQVPGLVEGLHRQLADYSEAEFLDALPSLRLAFSELIPDECDRVAAQVSRVTGREFSVEDHREFSPVEVARARSCEEAVLEAVRRDGLEGW
ncbi:MAG: DUF5682 family protein, partial [Candidatus Eremiobacterota bacterium]